MPPSPIYKVKFAGSFLPGFVQTEDAPLNLRVVDQNVLNRTSGLLSYHGAQSRRLVLQFIVLTRLGTGSTELQHVADCKEQVADAAAVLSRVSEREKLYVGNLAKYVYALPTTISAPLAAGTPRALRFTVEFITEAYWRDDTPITDTFTGNGTVSMTLPDTRATYPIISIPESVTAFTATHAASGKAVNFLRGTYSGTIIVNCEDFRVTNPAGTLDRSRTMENVNFGIAHTTGAGTFELDITGFAGSGTVTVSVTPRYEWND